MKRGAISSKSKHLIKKRKLKHSVDLTIDQLPSEMFSTIFSEMGFNFQDLARASQVSRLWHDQLQLYGMGLLDKYFPYIKKLYPEHSQKQALQLVLSEMSFFKTTFPDIDLKLILAALHGDKQTINSITDDTLKATLIGIMLSNNHSLENIDEKHRSTVCEVAFKLCANNGTLDLMKQFQALKGQPMTTAHEALECAARHGHEAIVDYLDNFEFNDQDIDIAVTTALVSSNIDMALYIQQRYLDKIDVKRMFRHATVHEDEDATEIILKKLIVPKELILDRLFHTFNLEIFKLLLSEYMALANLEQQRSLFPSVEPISIWNLRCFYWMSHPISLLEKQASLGNLDIVSYYLSLYDNNASDQILARNCKEAALSAAIVNLNINMVECLLKDPNIPLSAHAIREVLSNETKRYDMHPFFLPQPHKFQTIASIIQRHLVQKSNFQEGPLTSSEIIGSTIANGFYFMFGKSKGFGVLHVAEKLLNPDAYTTTSTKNKPI